MLHKRCASGLAKTRYHVNDSGWQADFGKPLCHLERSKWSLLCGLKHAGAPGGERWRKLPCRHE